MDEHGAAGALSNVAGADQAPLVMADAGYTFDASYFPERREVRTFPGVDFGTMVSYSGQPSMPRSNNAAHKDTQFTHTWYEGSIAF